MNRYNLKRGYTPDLERIRTLLVDAFSSTVEDTNDRLHLSYGALESMEAWFEGKELCVETVSATGASDEDVLDTNRRFRGFLVEATGYTAKQRQQKAKKEVKG